MPHRPPSPALANDRLERRPLREPQAWVGGVSRTDGNDGDQTPRWHMRAVTLMSSTLTCENVVSEGDLNSRQDRAAG